MVCPCFALSGHMHVLMDMWVMDGLRTAGTSGLPLAPLAQTAAVQRLFVI